MIHDRAGLAMRTKLIFLSMLLASCGGVPFLTPYKMDIRQGNLVTAEMRDKLKPGMSRQQVRYVLGTPMISDAFHGNRWDYVYRLEQDGKLVDKQRLTIYFEGDRLVRFEDELRSDDAAPATVAPEAAAVPAANPAAEVADAIAAPLTAVVPTVVAPVAAQAVAEASQPQPVAAASPSAEVWRTVQEWAAAWSDRDVPKYLAFYAPGFKPDGMSREDWERQRAERISKAKVTKVELSDLKVIVLDDSHATASFTQSYRSDRYNDVTHKSLQLERIGEAWLIVSEQKTK